MALPDHLRSAYDNAYATPEHEEIVHRIRAGELRVTVPESKLFTGTLRPFQHSGVTVAYLTPRLILGDVTGLGKTVQTLRYVALLIERGECSPARPVLILSEPKAFYDTWERDGFETFLPQRNVPRLAMTGEVPPRARREAYLRRSVPVIHLNYPIFLRDRKALAEAYPDGFAALVCDEASVIKSHGAQTSHAVKEFGQRTTRCLFLTATPIQTGLLDLHSILEGLQLHTYVGSEVAFNRRYHNYHLVQRTIRGRRITQRERDVLRPYRNLDELRTLVWPYYYRRGYADVPGEMPELSWIPTWVDLTAEQRQVYDALRLRQLPEAGQGYRFVLQARATGLKKIATSLQTVMHRAVDSSAKLDWLMSHLTGPWSDNGDGSPTKVVVYSTFKDTVLTLVRRLDAAGIGSVVFSGKGDLPDHGDGPRLWPHGSTPRERSALRQRFFDDPACQVLIGTTAIEMGLNLQAAPVLVNIDSLTNPARMRQIVGRIWRMNSVYRFVQVYSLFARGTVEEGVVRLLQERQSLIDTMNGEESPEAIFNALSNQDLEALVTTDWASVTDPLPSVSSF